MSLFKFPDDDVVTSYLQVAQKHVKGVRPVAPHRRRERALRVVRDDGSKSDLARQFIAFQLSEELEGPTILEAAAVNPNVGGSVEEPDVLVGLEMLSFHLGDSDEVEKDTRATLRVNLGKDQSSTDKTFDTVFWSIAAGLDLYDRHKNGPADSKDFKGDFRTAFGNRPIEIPGGLGRLSFEVIKHKEPPWWRKLLGFGQSQTAQSLVSVLGFPAITTHAIGVIDELLDRLDKSDPEILFQSIPMRVALSDWARNQFTGGNPRIRMGSLKQGFCVLARGSDFDTISTSDSVYYPHYGKLAPIDVADADLVAGNYDDPMKDVTYVVFRVAMKGTKLDPTFNFS